MSLSMGTLAQGGVRLDSFVVRGGQYAPWVHAAMAWTVDNSDRLWLFGGFQTGDTTTNAIGYMTEASAIANTITPSSASLPVALGYHRAVTLPAGTIWVTGGMQTPYTTPTSTWRTFDPTTQVWSSSSSSSVLARTGHGMAVLGSYVYVFGGTTGASLASPTASVYRYSVTDLYTGTAVASMPTPKDRFGYCVHSGEIWVAGGNYGGEVATVWSFDGTSWTARPNLPTAWGNTPQLWSVDGELFLTGGRRTGYENNDGVWQLTGSSWTRVGTMPIPSEDTIAGREQAAWGRLGDTLVIQGGYTVTAASVPTYNGNVFTASVLG